MSMREPSGGDDLLRDLVAGERAAMVPRPRARDATWAAVVHSVREGATPPLDATEIPGPVAASGGVASWLKIVVALALGGAAVGGVVVAAGGGARERPPAAERAIATERVRVEAAPAIEPVQEEIAETEAVAPAIDPLPAAATDAIEAAPESATGGVDASPSSIGKRESKTRAHARASEPVSPPPEPAASTLAEEARLIAAARRAFGRGAHDDALAKLAEHARRFADGQLAQERLALRARVHCDRGDVEQGRRAAAELRRVNPKSSQLARIDRECKARG